ncbi:MAG TPA: FecR family protein [Elusimicrobiota bacterium]|nr:FecR family protein [Elusimicrobiota bacterium]
MRKKFWVGSAALLFFAAAPLFARDVAGVITQIAGAVYLKEAGSLSYRQAKKGEFVYEGTTLKTGRGDRAAISFVSGTEVRINEETTYIIRPTHPSRRGQGNDTSLKQGRMWFKVLRKQSKFQIRTPVAAVSVRGTEGDVNYSQGNMHAACYEGSFEVSGRSGEDGDEGDTGGDDASGDGGSPGVTVGVGQLAVVTQGNPPEVRTYERKDNWQDRFPSGGKGTIKLVPEKTEADRKAAFKITLTAYDAGNRKDTSLNAGVTLYADHDDIEFSATGQSWARGPYGHRVSEGAAEFWVRGTKPGYVNVNAQTEGYDGVPARFMIAKPPQRELNVTVETEKGETKQLKLKFHR